MRRFAVLTSLSILPVPAAPNFLHAQAGNPALVVFITVDQFRPDYFTLYEAQLQGGLGRLYRGGAVFLDGYQDHAITETAPGHATTMSGRFPRSTGIVANTAGVGDPQSPLIGAVGEGASPFRFRGTALIDWMRYKDPRSRALSVSRKDRGAILPLGRAKQPAFWYALNGTFTTSSYYADTLPAWVQAFNARKLPQQWTGRAWSLLLDPGEYREPDSVAIENLGRDLVFPHPLPTDSAQAAVAVANYPMMDELTLSFALEGVRQLGLGAGLHTDLLAISLSSTDAVGHRFGPDSREIHDQILRLDRYLGTFFDSLFAIRDSTRVLIALTADHGVAPFPTTRSRYPNQGAGYVDLSSVASLLTASLRETGIDTSAFRFEESVLQLDTVALLRHNVNPEAVVRLFSQAAMKVPGVLRVDRVKDLALRDTVTDYVARRWLHMLPAELPARAIVTLKPYWYWMGVNYATHGSPHDYDARVPIILYGTGVKSGHYSQRALVVDMAPTLATLLHVTPMERLDGHVLSAALRE